MKSVSIRELHLRTGAVVREARRIGGLTVTERGAPVARIEPATRVTTTNPFRQRKLLPAYARLLRSGRLGAGTDSARIVAEDRDAR